MDAECCGRQTVLGMDVPSNASVGGSLGVGRWEIFFFWLEDHFGCSKKGEDLSPGIGYTEVLGPPPFPASKAWLEHKGPFCGGLISKHFGFRDLGG